MDESFKLDKEQHDAVYQKLEREMLSDSTPSAEPTVVIMGGQPGAGKSKLEKHLRKTTFAGKSPAVIDSDNYRRSHPQFEEISELDDKRMAERTNPDVRLWTQELLHSAVKNRRDIILQGTMRNKESMMETIDQLKKQGYKVHVAGLAVDAESSRLGILHRYEKQKEEYGYGRWVGPEFHDKAYKNFTETIRAIEHESHIDSIKIYNRKNELIYSNERCGDGSVKPPYTKDAAAAVAKERARPRTREEKQGNYNLRLETERRMKQRNAAAKEISQANAMIAGNPHVKEDAERLLQFAKQREAASSNVTEAPDKIHGDIFPAQDDRVYSGKIATIEQDKIFQEIAPETFIEHRREALGKISAADIGKAFTISYDWNGKAEVKQASLSQERGGIEI